MILAAGRGSRMRPLTDTKPKPLLTVGNKPLIVHHIERLKQAGISNLVVNNAWLGEQIETYLGDGSNFGVQIHHSPEVAGGLETAGGIIEALDFFADCFFLVLNADIWCDIDFRALTHITLLKEIKAHLILVANPEFHSNGDFGFVNGDYLSYQAAKKLTYSGVGIFHKSLFQNKDKGRLPLLPILKSAMDKQMVTGQVHQGVWSDVGTPQRLAELRMQFG